MWGKFAKCQIICKDNECNINPKKGKDPFIQQIIIAPSIVFNSGVAPERTNNNYIGREEDE